MRSPYHTVLEPKLIVDRPSEAYATVPIRSDFYPQLKGLKVMKPDF